jgi:hypothetical protein
MTFIKKKVTTEKTYCFLLTQPQSNYSKLTVKAISVNVVVRVLVYYSTLSPATLL